MIRYDTVDLRALKSWRDDQLNLAHAQKRKKIRKKRHDGLQKCHCERENELENVDHFARGSLKPRRMAFNARTMADKPADVAADCC